MLRIVRTKLYIWIFVAIAGWLQLLEDYYYPRGISAQTLTWFINYIFNIAIYSSQIIIKTKIFLLHPLVTLADFGYGVWALWFTDSHNFYIIWALNPLTLSAHDEGYSRNLLYALNLISKLVLPLCCLYIFNFAN